jgi:hypothetical protein
MFTAFMVALTLTTVANVLVTMALGPLFTALIARVFIGHKLPVAHLGAIVVAGVGIGWMYGSQVSLWGAGRADGLAGGAVRADCGRGAVDRHAAQPGPWRTAGPGALRAGGGRDLQRGDLAAVVPASWPPATDVAWLGLLGLVQLAIPCTLSVICARVLKAPEVSLLALLESSLASRWPGLARTSSPGQRAGGWRAGAGRAGGQ